MAHQKRRLTSIIRLTLEGIGVGVLSQYTLDSLCPDLPQYPVIPKIPFEIGLFANRLQDLSPAAAAFLRLLQE